MKGIEGGQGNYGINGKIEIIWIGGNKLNAQKIKSLTWRTWHDFYQSTKCRGSGEGNKDYEKGHNLLGNK